MGRMNEVVRRIHVALEGRLASPQAAAPLDAGGWSGVPIRQFDVLARRDQRAGGFLVVGMKMLARAELIEERVPRTHRRRNLWVLRMLPGSGGGSRRRGIDNEHFAAAQAQEKPVPDIQTPGQLVAVIPGVLHSTPQEKAEHAGATSCCDPARNWYRIAHNKPHHPGKPADACRDHRPQKKEE